MAAAANPAIASLCRSLGYDFRNIGLLQTALTHSSARVTEPERGDNDQLEFLGDRVLGLIVAELLAETFPQAGTGELALRYNRLVRKETCADVAREIALGAAIVMSDGEAESGGREKNTILGDACEALLGAVFLDGGFERARAVVRTLWQPYMHADEDLASDAKSALQEWAQGRGLALPRYEETERRGPDHAPQFTASVSIEGFAPQSGSGASKRAAEQNAAAAMLVREGVWKTPTDA